MKYSCKQSCNNNENPEIVIPAPYNLSFLRKQESKKCVIPEDFYRESMFLTFFAHGIQVDFWAGQVWYFAV